MATQTMTSRLTLRRDVGQRRQWQGAWWPRSRRLRDALPELFASWPPEAGRIARVLYSPPDWDDRPRMVAIPGRRVKTGCFPHDDTHTLVLSMGDRSRLTITVIPADTDAREAAAILGRVAPETDRGAMHPVWDNEGGTP